MRLEIRLQPKKKKVELEYLLFPDVRFVPPQDQKRDFPWQKNANAELFLPKSKFFDEDFYWIHTGFILDLYRIYNGFEPASERLFTATLLKKIRKYFVDTFKNRPVTYRIYTGIEPVTRFLRSITSRPTNSPWNFKSKHSTLITRKT